MYTNSYLFDQSYSWYPSNSHYTHTSHTCTSPHCHSPTISQLVAMSEYYLHQTPPLVSESVRCLIAVLTLSPPPRIEARVRLQLGLVLYHHTNNLVEARQHLDRAVSEWE